MKTRDSAWQPMPHPEGPLRAPPLRIPQCSSGEGCQHRVGGRTGQEALWGPPLFFLRVPGIRAGRVLWHPYRRPPCT